MRRILLASIGLLAACDSAPTPQMTTPPPISLGKADGGRAFFAPGPPLTFKLSGVEFKPRTGKVDDNVELHWIEGDRTFDRFDLTIQEDGRIEIRLRSSQRIEGMRRLVLVPMDAEALGRAVAAHWLFTRIGVPAPGVVGVQLQIGEITAPPLALVEHVGGSFFEDRFGDRDGIQLSVEPTVPIEGRIGAILARAQGPRAWRHAFNLDALLGFYAIDRLLGAANAHQVFDPCHRSGCAVPFPTDYTYPWSGNTFADAHLPDDGVLREPGLIEAIDYAFSAAIQLTHDPRLEQAVIATSPQAAADVLAALTVQGDALKTWLAQQQAGDRPDGRPNYRPFTGATGDPLVAQFRWLGPGPSAKAVSIQLGAETHALTFDPARNLWRAQIPRPDGRAPYDFLVQLVDGTHLTVEDPVPGGGVVDPSRVDQLVLIDKYDIDVAEPSGLAVWGDRLLVVGDQKSKAYVIDPTTGRIEDKIELGASDMEAIAVDPVTNELLITLESKGQIWRLSPDGDRVDTIKLGWADDNNSGLEGLAVRPADGHIFVAKEKKPVRIAELTPSGDRLHRLKIKGVSDLSELSWAGGHGTLYALSDEDQRLFRLTPDLKIDAVWPLPINKPEGLAIVGSRVFVASDDDEQIYLFDLEDGRQRL